MSINKEEMKKLLDQCIGKHEYYWEEEWKCFIHYSKMTAFSEFNGQQHKMFSGCYPFIDKTVKKEDLSPFYKNEGQLYFGTRSYNVYLLLHGFFVLGDKTDVRLPSKDVPLLLENREKGWVFYLCPMLHETRANVLRDTYNYFKRRTGCTCPVILKTKIRE